MFNRSHTKIGLTIAAMAFITALVINGFNNYTTAELCEKAQKNLRIKEQQALDGLVWLDKIIKPKGNSFIDLKEEDKKAWAIKDISLFAFINDTLSFWTSNLVPLEFPINRFTEKNGMIPLRNGWY